jgi:hypothetical protein
VRVLIFRHIDITIFSLPDTKVVSFQKCANFIEGSTVCPEVHVHREQTSDFLPGIM